MIGERGYCFSPEAITLGFGVLMSYCCIKLKSDVRNS